MSPSPCAPPGSPGEKWPAPSVSPSAKCPACGQLLIHHFAGPGIWYPFKPDCPKPKEVA